MKPKDELLLKVAERYLLHKNYQTTNPFTRAMLDKLCEVEIDEMWMLTQGETV